MEFLQLSITWRFYSSFRSQILYILAGHYFLIDILSVTTFFTQQLKYGTPKIPSSESQVWADHCVWTLLNLFLSFFPFKIVIVITLEFWFGFFPIILVEEVNSVASIMVNTFTDEGMSVWLWPSDYFRCSYRRQRKLVCGAVWKTYWYADRNSGFFVLQGILETTAFTNYSYKPTIPVGLI